MRSDILRIVSIVDFSALSRVGLDLGIALKRRLKAELLVFHAVNVPGDQVCGSDYAHNKPRQQHHLILAKRQMDRFLGLSADGTPVVVCGEPVEELVRQGQNRRIDLIIAPSQGISGFRRLYTGTIVERLVRRIDCPVLIVRPPKQTSKFSPVCPHRIVAGMTTDGRSKDILYHATMAARVFDAHLHLVHILEAPPDVEDEPYETAQQHLQIAMSQDLVTAARNENMPPDRVTATVLTGMPGEVILDYIADIQADLVVVGVRRTSALKKNLIGSTTEALIRHSPCSILTLPVQAGGPRFREPS